MRIRTYYQVVKSQLEIKFMENMKMTNEKTIKLKGGGKIREIRTEIDVPHLDEILTFMPYLSLNNSFGIFKGPYNKVMSEISKDKLLRPTTAQIFSLIDLALKNRWKEEHCNVIDGALYYGFWTSTEVIHISNDKRSDLNLPFSDIIYDNIDGKIPSDDIETILKRFDDGDKSLRTADSYSHPTGVRSISDFVNHPYIIAQVGDKDFAEDVVARVANQLSSKNEPLISVKNSESHEHTKVYTMISSHLDRQLLRIQEINISPKDNEDYIECSCLGLYRKPKLQKSQINS